MLSRGYAEDVGATHGCIVDAIAKETKESAFCLSTDATGVCIQPEPLASGRRQPCRKGQLCAAGHSWPRDRYIELAPKYWAATRARLDPAELGPLTVPPPSAKQQSTPS